MKKKILTLWISSLFCINNITGQNKLEKADIILETQWIIENTQQNLKTAINYPCKFMNKYNSIWVSWYLTPDISNPNERTVATASNFITNKTQTWWFIKIWYNIKEDTTIFSSLWTINAIRWWINWVFCIGINKKI